MATGKNESDFVSITVEFTFVSLYLPFLLTRYLKRAHANGFCYSGGLEMLFSNERKHNVTLPARLNDGSQPNITYLLQHLVENVMKDERKELFILEDNV